MEFVSKVDLIETIFKTVKSREFEDLIRAYDALYEAKANATTDTIHNWVVGAINEVKKEINRVLSIGNVPVCVEDFDDNFNTCDVMTERAYVSVLMAFDDVKPWENPMIVGIYINLGNLSVEIWNYEWDKN